MLAKAYMVLDRRFWKLALFWAMITAVALVAAKCGESGMYQGGGDSEPHWR